MSWPQWAHRHGLDSPDPDLLPAAGCPKSVPRSSAQIPNVPGFHVKRVFSDSDSGPPGVPSATDQRFSQPQPCLIHVSYYLF